MSVIIDGTAGITNTGAEVVTGNVTAAAFIGNGASLTGIAGGFSNMQVFTSPGTFTTPSSTTKIKVTVMGGGGSGGNPTGGGGGGGGYGIYVGPVTASTPYAVTVGAGGTTPSGPNVSGNSGGTTSFGAVVSATGGGGGIYPAGAGGAGGTATGATFSIAGQNGQSSPTAGQNDGGSSALGFARLSGNSGQLIVGYGVGGSSGPYGPIPAGGATIAGVAGVVIVEY